MADQENKTIINAADPRVDSPAYVYSGRTVEEDVYVGASPILQDLVDAGLIPAGFDLRDLKTDEDFQNFVDSLPVAQELRNSLYRVYYSNAVSREYGVLPSTVEIRGRPSSVNTNNVGKTPIEEVALVYDPETYSTPSIRGAGQGLSTDDSRMQKAPHDDPPEGREIAQVVRSMNRPYLIPMFLDMVDSSLTRQGIYIGNEFIVTTIKLSPNPETMTVNSSKKINRYTTMTRWVEEHWGDEMDTVSLNGSTFSFFGYLGQNSAGNRGLTSRYRNETQAYVYMRELVKFFQANGCIYQGGSDYEDPGYLAVTDFLNSNPEFYDNHPRKGMIKERLYVRLTYDYLRFIGRFESFDIIEDATSPFRFQYSMIFKAEKTEYLLDKAPSNGATYPSNVVNPGGRAYDDISDTVAQEGAFV